jgi:hypothetical protein
MLPGCFGSPSSRQHVGAICDAFAEQDRMEKIAGLAQKIETLRADPRIIALEAEVARLKKMLDDRSR